MTPANLNLESTAVYLLGFIGFAAVGLLPYRSLLLLIDITRSPVPYVRKRFVFVVAIVIFTIALWVHFDIGIRIFHCLTKTYCGPSIASGWVYLAILGIIYIFIEAVSFLLRKVIKN